MAMRELDLGAGPHASENPASTRRFPLRQVVEAEQAGPGVLVAEDDPAVRDALAETLAELGFRVLGGVGDGEAALSMAEATQPDVVLMDVRMPGMDGIEATRRIRELAFGPEVVMLSVHGEFELRGQAEAAGACAYLPKDCDPGVLADAIWEALAHRPSPFIHG